jgi:ATP-dependent Clp protease adapter protein ClpS
VNHDQALRARFFQASLFARDIAESKAVKVTDLGRSAGHPLSFTTEPEE